MIKSLIILWVVGFSSTFAQSYSTEQYRPIRTGNWLELSFCPTDDQGNALNDFIHINDPQFPGGFDSLARFFDENLKYPETAIRDSVSGLVRTQFIINKAGRVESVKNVTGIRDDLDSACIRVISSLPPWQQPAAYESGEPVDCFVILPIRFVLNPEQSH